MIKKVGTDDGETLLDVEEIPKIDDDRGADGEEREEADHLARDCEGQEDARQDHPCPPRLRELAVSVRQGQRSIICIV